MSEFQQSLFDVDNTMNSVFDDAQDLASQFEYTTEADEDDRMMGIVLGEDGTELPKFDELHNNEKSALGDEKESFADGIFGDETDNAPKCDPAKNGSQLDKDNGAEGSHTYFDGSCPVNGVQDAGKSSDDDKDASDLKTSTKKASEVISDERAKEIADKELATEAWLDTMYEDYAEGTTAPIDIKDGVQDNGDASAVFDDDDVEDIGDQMDDAKCDSCDEVARMGDASGAFSEDEELGLHIPGIGQGQVKDANKEFQSDLDESFIDSFDESNEIGFGADTSDLGLHIPRFGKGQLRDTDKEPQSDLDESFIDSFDESNEVGFGADTSDLGLDLPDEEEGQVKDANSVFQDDLDESFLMEEDDVGVTSYDGGDYEDDDDVDDDVDDYADDSEDDEIDEAFFFESDDKGQATSYKASLDMDNDDEGQQKVTSDEVQQMKNNEKSSNEGCVIEDDIEDELNGVIDDEDLRHGAGNAVKYKEGECSFADDLEESFFMEDTDPEVVDNVDADTATDEIEDDSEVEDIDDDSDSDTPDLSYTDDDDELFDSVNED